MKKNLERWIHLNMAFIGGFIGGYAILNHCDLFGSAQTANMITIALDLSGRADVELFVRILGLFIYMTGLSFTVFLPKILKVNLKLFSVIIDGVALMIVGFLPEDLNHFIALYPLFFATAFQWCSFKGADGFVSSSIFSTNNLRQFTTSYAEYFCTRDKEALRKGKFFGKVLLSYHLGAALCCVSCMKWGLSGAWICLVPVGTAFVLVMTESKWNWVKNRMKHVSEAPQDTLSSVSYVQHHKV